MWGSRVCLCFEVCEGELNSETSKTSKNLLESIYVQFTCVCTVHTRKCEDPKSVFVRVV